MLLAEAANIATRLRTNYHKRLGDRSRSGGQYEHDSRRMMKEVMLNRPEEYEDLIDIFYPKHSRYQRQFISIDWLRNNVCKELGISTLAWDDALMGRPIVPTLAIESSEFCGEGMTVKQALMLMHRIREEGFLSVAEKMNENEALLFWSRALDEQYMLPIDRFLQTISHLSSFSKHSLLAIRNMLDTMTPHEALIRIMKHEDETLHEIRTMQPGMAFSSPIYRGWNKTTTPETVYAEYLERPRRYLHITEFPEGTYTGVLYNKEKQVSGTISQFTLPYTKAEAIFEVEVDTTIIKSITDIMAHDDDWGIHKMDYADRIEYLNGLSLKVPVNSGKLIEGDTDLHHLLETISSNGRLRLTLPGPFKIGEHGGWIILKDSFHLHLLVTAIKKDEEFHTHVRLAAMDGYETYDIGETSITVGVAQHMRVRLAKIGVLVGKTWMPVEEHGMVVMAEVTGVDLKGMRATHINVIHMDDNMGYSDVSQLTDLAELGN